MSKKRGIPFEQFVDGKWVWVKDSTYLAKQGIIRLAEIKQPQASLW